MSTTATQLNLILRFLAQIDKIGRCLGLAKARQSYERTLGQLAPELQEVARRHGLDKLPL